MQLRQAIEVGPAIDVKRLACNETRLVAHQSYYRRADILRGVPVTAEGIVARDRLGLARVVAIEGEIGGAQSGGAKT